MIAKIQHQKLLLFSYCSVQKEANSAPLISELAADVILFFLLRDQTCCQLICHSILIYKGSGFIMIFAFFAVKF